MNSVKKCKDRSSFDCIFRFGDVGVTSTLPANVGPIHYSDVTMSGMTSKITGLSIVCSIMCSGTKLLVTGLFTGNPSVTGGFPSKGHNAKMCPFDEVVMRSTNFTETEMPRWRNFHQNVNISVSVFYQICLPHHHRIYIATQNKHLWQTIWALIYIRYLVGFVMMN